ncbi:unnamed protein product, partial [Iphiclides podalirius]
MAGPTWPPGSRRMLRDAAPVHSDISTIRLRAARHGTHLSTVTNTAIDTTAAVIRRHRRCPARVQQRRRGWAEQRDVGPMFPAPRERQQCRVTDDRRSTQITSTRVPHHRRYEIPGVAL